MISNTFCCDWPLWTTRNVSNIFLKIVRHVQSQIAKVYKLNVFEIEFHETLSEYLHKKALKASHTK